MQSNTLLRKKKQRSFDRCFFLFFLFLLPAYGLAGNGIDYQRQAQLLRLAEQAEWHRLLHYEPVSVVGLHAGVESTATDSFFFLSEDGRNNPEAELQATLEALFSTAVLPEREEPVACVFPARKRWLQEVLSIPREAFPKVDCQRYHDWKKRIDAESITLVFPDAYINSPASMFGHTLLRLNQRRYDENAPLLGYAVNYAADTPDTNGLVFAYKGLTGGYPGNFGVFPYYEKVKEYGHIENRDLWEYPLDFNAEQLEKVLMHLWELRGVTFDYYFVRRNCSYQLLSLLAVADPDILSPSDFPLQAPPVDTVRSLRKLGYLPQAAVLRPSKAADIESRRLQMAVAERAQTVALAAGDKTLADYPDGVSATVLEMAHDLLYYRFRQGRESKEDGLPRARKLLIARAKLGVQENIKDGTSSTGKHPPDAGHPASRLDVRFGRFNDAAYMEMRARPVFHDPLDPPTGFVDGSRINFFNLALRYYQPEQRIRLNRFDILDLSSAAPRTEFIAPVSWHVSTGFRQPNWRVDASQRPFAYLRGGAGLTYERDDVRQYLWFDMELDADNDLRAGHRGALGFRAGLLAHRGDLSLQLETQYLLGVSGEKFDWMAGDLEVQYNLSYQSAMRAGINLGVKTNTPANSQQRNLDWQLAWLYYF